MLVPRRVNYGPLFWNMFMTCLFSEGDYLHRLSQQTDRIQYSSDEIPSMVQKLGRKDRVDFASKNRY